MPGLDSEKNIVAVPAQPPKQCTSKQTLLVAKLSSSSPFPHSKCQGLTATHPGLHRPAYPAPLDSPFSFLHLLGSSLTGLSPCCPYPRAFALVLSAWSIFPQTPTGPFATPDVACLTPLSRFVSLFMAPAAKTLHDLSIDLIYHLSPLACKLREGRVFVQPVQLCPPQRRF